MAAAKRIALVTASYVGDFERCVLLCDSIDRFVQNRPDHFILVDHDDYPLFLKLTGPRRHIINELDILPRWLHSARQGFSKSSRKIWFSSRTWPMRGWHVQQLRRIAIAQYLGHDGLLYCDSDSLFVKPFNLDALWRDNELRLYRNPQGINDSLPGGGVEHKKWTRCAAALNGLAPPVYPAHDYINNLVSWRREDVIGMCENIERITGRHWVAAIGSNRTFSECQIYGAYVDGVLEGRGHWHAPSSLCQTYWAGDALTANTATGFVDQMDPKQVAIGIQSFTGTDPAVLRHLLTV